MYYQHEGCIPNDHEPYFLQPLDPRVTIQVLVNSSTHIGDDEDADYDLETPIDDVLVREYYNHKEHDEGQQNQEFLLRMS